MKKTLARSAFYNLLYTASNALFPLVTAVYIARVLAPEGVGRVAYARNLVSYFTMFSVLGIPQYGMREIARREENADKLFSELVVLGFLTTAVCAAAYLLFIHICAPADAIYLVFGLELLFAFFNIDWLYQGKEEYGFLTARSLVTKLLTLVLMLIFVRERQDALIYGLILCIGKGFGYLCGFFRAGKYGKLTLRSLDLRRHLRPVLTLMLGSAALSLYSKVDITMLGWLAGERAVGYYTNAHKVVNIVIALSVAVSAVFLPRLSRGYQEDKACYSETVSTGLKAVLFLALPCCVGLGLVADDLTAVLFGPLFEPAAVPIRILSLLVIVKGVGDILCYQVLISSGNEGKLIRAYLLAGAVNIALNALLIPRYGHNGAAAASVISELAVNGILLRYSLTIAKPRISGGLFVSLTAATAAMALSVLLVQSMVRNNLLALAVSMAVGAAVYGLAVLSAHKVQREGESVYVHGNKRRD